VAVVQTAVHQVVEMVAVRHQRMTAVNYSHELGTFTV
jgi:hypothetical protein